MLSIQISGRSPNFTKRTSGGRPRNMAVPLWRVDTALNMRLHCRSQRPLCMPNITKGGFSGRQVLLDGQLLTLRKVFPEVHEGTTRWTLQSPSHRNQ